MQTAPTRIERHSDAEMLIAWPSGSQFAVPYSEIRYACPCASCVDEMTGERVLRRENVASDVRPVGVSLVGRYAVQIRWSDGHATGIYPFERLERLCQEHGRNA